MSTSAKDIEQAVKSHSMRVFITEAELNSFSKSLVVSCSARSTHQINTEITISFLRLTISLLGWG
jgi:hypothetical protein